MRRKRRDHSPAFKAKVDLTAIADELTMAAMTKKFDVHAHQITTWKKQLVALAPDVFGKPQADYGDTGDTEETINSLRAKVGQLTMENALGERGLTKIHGPRGKNW
ncbi:MAG: transposase [Myxococcales bacterium]|nr:transposase [Myxococcales bacterium]